MRKILFFIPFSLFAFTLEVGNFDTYSAEAYPSVGAMLRTQSGTWDDEGKRMTRFHLFALSALFARCYLNIEHPFYMDIYGQSYDGNLMDFERESGEYQRIPSLKSVQRMGTEFRNQFNRKDLFYETNNFYYSNFLFDFAPERTRNVLPSMEEWTSAEVVWEPEYFGLANRNIAWGSDISEMNYITNNSIVVRICEEVSSIAFTNGVTLKTNPNVWDKSVQEILDEEEGKIIDYSFNNIFNFSLFRTAGYISSKFRYIVWYYKTPFAVETMSQEETRNVTFDWSKILNDVENHIEESRAAGREPSENFTIADAARVSKILTTNITTKTATGEVNLFSSQERTYTHPHIQFQSSVITMPSLSAEEVRSQYPLLSSSEYLVYSYLGTNTVVEGEVYWVEVGSGGHDISRYDGGATYTLKKGSLKNITQNKPELDFSTPMRDYLHGIFYSRYLDIIDDEEAKKEMRFYRTGMFPSLYYYELQDWISSHMSAFHADTDMEISLPTTVTINAKLFESGGNTTSVGHMFFIPKTEGPNIPLPGYCKWTDATEQWVELFTPEPAVIPGGNLTLGYDTNILEAKEFRRSIIYRALPYGVNFYRRGFLSSPGATP